ncbi:PDIL5-4 [Symbiodinium pilosum]|uniref:PDIL5-4 protein n=1 Tax=Symbiodinium pilosum TaxID=2952 RepID=A0A812X4D9_SYMPI|nr:PDIL5-4 [Symbiodinium pilosum]
MLDIDCSHLTVGVDHKGTRKGQPYKEEELLELEFSDRSFTPEELAELDSDWGSSSDHFKHNDFQAVIDAHDFTMINFYADWCSHCRDFAATWFDFEKAVNEHRVVANDADGKPAAVHLLRLNCVDFQDTCREQMIRFFPAVRLYRRSAKKGEFEEYSGERNADGMTRWLQSSVAQRHLHTGATYHSVFSEGCRVSGSVNVARVPGTVHFQVGQSKERDINPAFTNVSHTVHHFSFGEAPRGLKASLPRQYRSHVNPLDGQTFLVDKFHKAPSHFIKVVHTRFEDSDLRSYQQTHQWSVRTLQRGTTPQAKFSFDLSPVEVVIGKSDRRWYDYITQIFAITGGAFTVMSLAAGFLKASSVHVKSMLDKLS